MKMYFVGGFLGSGKTSAIANVCRLLIAEGKRVGVVTNDQGKLQVDSLFMQASGIPTVEVGGGCFCCKYDDFDARVALLVERDRPDSVFAESVGSCADVIATVVKPFEAFRENYGTGSVYSVFADSRLLLARLSGVRLPFGEDILYLFDRQLEEADLIVLNKRDLLSQADRNKLAKLAALAWPGKPSIEISGSDLEGAEAWLEAMRSLPEGPREGLPLEIDYSRYGSGEMELSWLDERLVMTDAGGLSSDGTRCRTAVVVFLRELAKELAGKPIGHLKLFVRAPGLEVKVGITSGDFLGEAFDAGRDVPAFYARRADVTVNARVRTDPAALSGAVSAAAAAAGRIAGVAIREEDRSAFRPGLPEPTHRM